MEVEIESLGTLRQGWEKMQFAMPTLSFEEYAEIKHAGMVRRMEEEIRARKAGFLFFQAPGQKPINVSHVMYVEPEDSTSLEVSYPYCILFTLVSGGVTWRYTTRESRDSAFAQLIEGMAVEVVA